MDAIEKRMQHIELHHDNIAQQLKEVDKEINPLTSALKEENEAFRKVVLDQERFVKDLQKKLKISQAQNDLLKELSAKWAKRFYADQEQNQRHVELSVKWAKGEIEN